MEAKFKKAGIIIVGNEIIKGLVKDENSIFICKRFYALGVKVCKITAVPDEVEEIAEEVAKFSERFDIVVTTGGIGPTHDDVTYEAIAAALGERVILNLEMAEVIRSYFPPDSDFLANPALKMAVIPESSKLVYVRPKYDEEEENLNGGPFAKKSFPIVQVKNVYALPGMKKWLEQTFDHLQEIFENPAVNMHTMVKFIKLAEVKILNELNKTVAEYQNRVVIGSYPLEGADKVSWTKIVMEGTSVDDVTAASSYLTRLLPENSVNAPPDRKDADLVYELSYGFKSLPVAVKQSLKVIEKALKAYDPDDIYISFNGGKDCTLLVHLVWAVNMIMGEVENFIMETTKRYNLNLVTVFGSIKDALTELYAERPNIKALFVGTRRTDPKSENHKSFQLCDEGWPQLMRVNPILDWTYHDVWDFLRLLSVPYCSLYDKGYTSIGDVNNTQRNDALKISRSNELNNFEPAYKLKDVTLERQGRE